MRQAVEPSWKESLDAIEALVAILLNDSGNEQAILEGGVAALVDMLDYSAALIVTGDEEQNRYFLRAYALRVGAEAEARLSPLLREARDGERGLTPRENAQNVFELLYPLLEREEASHWQEMAEVRAVRMLPLALPGERLGSLLTMSRRHDFGGMERRVLQATAQHLALGIRNAQLYQRLEAQESAAQTFAHMAFSGSAYVHTLRNQIGGLRTYLGLVKVLPQLPPEQRNAIVATSRKALENLDQAAEILDHLHEPWRRQPDIDTDANDCLMAALTKVFGGLAVDNTQQATVTSRGLRIEWQLADDLPALHTSPEMLTEAFRIVIRNAADALYEKYGVEKAEGGLLQVESVMEDNHVVMTIRDNGPGIAPSDARRIFDMGWSTKKGIGMGFGLFWARSFVEGLGGRIEVQSVQQEGAAFRFLLPAPRTVPG